MEDVFIPPSKTEIYHLSLLQSLVEDLKSELGGHFETTVIALLTPPYEYLIDTLNDSLSVCTSKHRKKLHLICLKKGSFKATFNFFFQISLYMVLAKTCVNHY